MSCRANYCREWPPECITRPPKTQPAAAHRRQPNFYRWRFSTGGKSTKWKGPRGRPQLPVTSARLAGSARGLESSRKHRLPAFAPYLTRQSGQTHPGANHRLPLCCFRGYKILYVPLIIFGSRWFATASFSANLMPDDPGDPSTLWCETTGKLVTSGTKGGSGS